MTLHQADGVLHQQIPLHLHDGRRRRTHKIHREIIACIVCAVHFLIFVIEVGVIKRDLNGCAAFSQIIQSHAHLVEGMTEIFVTRNRPAHLQQMRLHVKTNTGLFFIRADSAIHKRLGPRVFPQWFERLLKLLEANIGAQWHFAMHVNFKRGVVTWHKSILTYLSPHVIAVTRD